MADLDSDSDRSFLSLDVELEDVSDNEDPLMPEIDLKNFQFDTEYEEDYLNDWMWILDSDRDNVFNVPFTGQDGQLNTMSNNRAPEAFLKHCLILQCGKQ